MPIYEYECGSCGHKLEMIQKISAAPLANCPECDTGELKKLVSASAFQLKGGGWYETDFKHNKDKSDKDKTAESSASAAPACGTDSCCPAASD